MKNTLAQFYTESKPISFSYEKKYWINYSHKLIEGPGQFKGLLYGIGLVKLDEVWTEYLLIMENGKYYAIYADDAKLDN